MIDSYLLDYAKLRGVFHVIKNIRFNIYYLLNRRSQYAGTSNIVVKAHCYLPYFLL